MNPGNMHTRITLVTYYNYDGEVVIKNTDVWAEKVSVTKYEFYASQTTELNPQFMLKIRPTAYEISGQLDSGGIKKYASSVKIGGQEYKIIRIYETDEQVELICG